MGVQWQKQQVTGFLRALLCLSLASSNRLHWASLAWRTSSLKRKQGDVIFSQASRSLLIKRGWCENVEIFVLLFETFQCIPLGKIRFGCLALVTQVFSYSHQLGDASHLFTYLFVFFFCFALSSVLLYTNTLTNPTTCFGLWNLQLRLPSPPPPASEVQ